MEEYDNNALKISRVTTRHYSTSFSIGVQLLKKKLRPAIYAIYGFVRFADEIVDTFHDHPQERMLGEFRADTFRAIDEGISTNPILHSFQWVVTTYRIDHALIHAFLDSMEMDLHDRTHTAGSFEQYVYGSAEVVGLMCLRVFYPDDQTYEALKAPARKLGEAFQKINFLRDIRSDYRERGRVYFPGMDLRNLDDATKKKLEENIAADFEEAREGIRRLNRDARLGVLISYTYYLKLFRKIRRTTAANLFCQRYRISNFRKMLLLANVWMRFKLRIA
jgi:phytoene/squalene synthetase